MSDHSADPQIADADLDNTLEQRADYLPLEKLREGTATSDLFDAVHKELVGRGTKLLVGPRGCGKTHVMRYTLDKCVGERLLPFPVYVTFNRYYRLEPLLKARPNATDLFHVWVLANIVRGVHDTLRLIDADSSISGERRRDEQVGIAYDALTALVSRLERGLPLSVEGDALVETLSVEHARRVIGNIAIECGRRRSILLLDDAALTLTPQYLYEFFDTIRVLKSTDVSIKASVYPGTTEYGPRFHATQEGDLVPLWLSVEDANYSSVMGSIGQRRVPEMDRIPQDVAELLKFAAFGIPRAYLSMLAEFRRGGFATTQQAVNSIVQSHIAARVMEYKSLSLKAPRFATLIEKGEAVFKQIVRDLREANETLADQDEKQLIVGITGVREQPLVDRLFHLLVEAGLLYEHPQVSHGGPERTYQRFTPHISALLEIRAFSAKEKGMSPSHIVSYLRRKSSKHPVRRSIATLLPTPELANLGFNLPPCAQCGTARMTDQQRFCHGCGGELIDSSTFDGCMRIPLSQVPGLTTWQLTRIRESLPQFGSIGDLLAHQDPGTELRKIPWVGQRRATKIVTVITNYVEEFLS